MGHPDPGTGLEETWGKDVLLFLRTGADTGWWGWVKPKIRSRMAVSKQRYAATTWFLTGSGKFRIPLSRLYCEGQTGLPLGHCLVQVPLVQRHVLLFQKACCNQPPQDARHNPDPPYVERRENPKQVWLPHMVPVQFREGPHQTPLVVLQGCVGTLGSGQGADTWLTKKCGQENLPKLRRGKHMEKSVLIPRPYISRLVVCQG